MITGAPVSRSANYAAPAWSKSPSRWRPVVVRGCRRLRRHPGIIDELREQTRRWYDIGNRADHLVAPMASAFAHPECGPVLCGLVTGLDADRAAALRAETNI